MIDRALVIAPPWMELILSGEKTWEIRGRPNSRTGRIALALKGGPLVGTATIGRSHPLDPEEFDQYYPKHCVTRRELREMYGDRPIHAWPLADPTPLNPPIEYTHPRGGSWVTLTPQNVPEWERLQES